MKRLLFTILLTWGASGAALAQPAMPTPEWTPCAHEGQTCYTPGPAQIRMVGDGRATDSKNSVGSIDCSVSNFGDPGRRAAKYCEYKLGWAAGLPRPVREAQDDAWVDCAKEDEVCRFRGTRLVRFGVESAYYYRTESREIPCTVAEFGDPVRRVPKQCQYKRVDEDREPARGAGGRDGDRDQGNRPSNRWALCAVQGENCRVSDTTLVRFGREGAYTYRQVDREVTCSSRAFGDPAPGVVKICEANTVPVDRSVARRPDPDEIPPMDDRLWADCASEGQNCNFRGGEHVRYGANGAYKVLYANNGLQCNNPSFGGDPLPGVRKRCAVYRP